MELTTPLLQQSESPLDTRTILVVEDEEAVLRLLIGVLKREGFTVLSAATPQTALAIAEWGSVNVHLLLTDLTLPGMSGGELHRRMAVRFPDLKVVYLSGYSPGLIEGQGPLFPTTPFLRKPFTLDLLIRTVREAMGS